MRQTVVTATGADALPLEPAQLVEVTPGAAASALMERLGGDVRASSPALGPGGHGEIAAIVRAWPAAVGEAIARNAWPARIARDGTLHVTRRLGDLGVRARPHARRRSSSSSAHTSASGRRRRSGSPPDRCPSPSRSGSTDRATHRREPGGDDRAEAAELAAPIEDEELREAVARAAAASLARAPIRPPVSDTLTSARKWLFAGLF